ncbi:MAG: glycosyl transferase family 90 [Paracoccus sp. (in: a-proteobacteria)]|uniref:glycosyl transferase family 90 n=1 Tax=Paracoccus sp. TaxID=267 RepID=UPI003002E255
MSHAVAKAALSGRPDRAIDSIARPPDKIGHPPPASRPVLSRKFFQIGFNKCGTTFIARLFAMNGIPTVHWEENGLAEDIAFSKLSGRAPLQPWAHVTALTDMESVRSINLPIVEAFREFAYLDRSFPGSVFLLNTRRVEDWIISRYRHRGGRYARACAQARGVGLPDLADLWQADWDAHLAAVRSHFAGRPELIQIDIDKAGPADYRDALAPYFDLPTCPDLPGPGLRRKRAGYLPALDRMLNTPRAAIPAADHDRIAGGLAAFARPARIRMKPVGFAACSGQFATFDAATGKVAARGGVPLPILPDAGRRFHLDPAFPRWMNVAAAVNDIAEVASRGLYYIDMQPACRAGAGDVARIGRPILAPSRRAGAENVFLWPAPRAHWPGNDAFLGNPDRADPPFPDKRDRAIWRGALSDDAAEDGAPPGADRLGFVAAHAGSTDVDAAFLPGDRAALDRRGHGGLATGRADEAFLLSHRYLICLGGVAGLRDFAALANTRSVVLKEEDDWQGFHSGLFQPWRHYVPLAQGCGDLAERLAWARANPAECGRISERARAICAALADPDLRRRHLTRVLQDYRAATGQ